MIGVTDDGAITCHLLSTSAPIIHDSEHILVSSLVQKKFKLLKIFLSILHCMCPSLTLLQCSISFACHLPAHTTPTLIIHLPTSSM